MNILDTTKVNVWLDNTPEVQLNSTEEERVRLVEPRKGTMSMLTRIGG